MEQNISRAVLPSLIKEKLHEDILTYRRAKE